MTIHITATQLRKDVYRLLDQVVDAGEVIEVKRKGKLIRIEPVVENHKLESLKSHPGTICGDPEELVHIDWPDQWQPSL